MSSKKIKTKNQALQLLNELCTNVSESAQSLNIEFIFCSIAINQMSLMKNSINNSEDFFNTFFKDKTREEIVNWINEESKNWS